MRRWFAPIIILLIPGFNRMARPTNSFESVTMTIAVTPQIKMYLEDLTADGMYGCSPSEAARRHVARQSRTRRDRRKP